MHLGIAPKERDAKRLDLIKKVKPIGAIFVITCLLPIIVYLLFHFQVFKSKPIFPVDLEQPIANVVTRSGTGTAFLTGETRLLTAKHIFEGIAIGEIVQLTFEKADPTITTEARLIWKEPTESEEPESYLYDIAVLELTNPTALPANYPRLPLGSSEGIGTREEVILIGYPAGLYSITNGIISNDNIRDLELFQLDAGAWPGSSGGPLILDQTHEAIGILVAGFQGEFQGINMANKIDNVQNLLDKAGVNVME